MKLIIKKSKQIFLLMLTLSVALIACVDDNLEKPQVVAGYTYTLNPDTGVVTFINISEKANTYEWDFADGTTSTEINPTKIFGTGEYTVVLLAKNVSGASNIFESTIIIDIPLPFNLPSNFDDLNVRYNATGFNGASFSVVDNPAPGGTNNVASKVGAITNIGAAYEGVSFNLGAQLDLATLKSIKMNFWSDSPVAVLFKLENGTAADVEFSASHGGTGWEELIFNFSSSAKYGSITLFVDGPGTKSGTFYFDDIMQTETPAPPCVPETAQSLLASNFNLTFQTNPTSSIVSDGGAFSWIDNPDTSKPLNTSCKVGQVVRDAGLQYANNQISLASALNFTNKSGFKMKVWSAAIGTKVTVKLEGGVVTEVDQLTTKANEWEELTFDFAATVTGNNKIVLFFNIGTNTPGTFYFDDFMLYGTGTGGGSSCTGTNLTLPTNFDCSTIDYVSKDSGDVAFEVVDNPQLSGINATPSKVGKLVFDSNQQWENMNLRYDTPISFATNKVITFKFYSASTRVLKLKFEGGGTPVETDVNHSGNGWEQLSFTMNTSASFSNFVLFVDGGSNTVGTFYIDDIVQVGSTGGGGGGSTCPAPPAGDLVSNGNFEAGEGCWQLISNGGETTISNTESNGGGSKSAQIKTLPLKNPGVKQERFGVGTVLPATSYTVKFDVKATDALADGAVLQAFVFSEGAEGGTIGATQHVLVQGLGNVSTSWETKTYTFTSGATANNVAGGFSLLLELVCGGATSCKGTIVVDNVSIRRTP